MTDVVRESQPAVIAVVTVNEQNPVLFSGTLTKETGLPVPLVDLSTLTLTLYDQVTDAIINSRDDQSILNANGGTFHATSGAFALTLGPSDNVILGAPATGQAETHIALIEATWAGGGYWSGVVHVRVRQVHRVP